MQALKRHVGELIVASILTLQPLVSFFLMHAAVVRNKTIIFDKTLSTFPSLLSSGAQVIIDKEISR